MQYEMEQVSIRMVKEPPLISDRPITGPDSAVDIIGEYLGDFDRELMVLVNLRNDGKPINMNIMSIGTINASIACPREALKASILNTDDDILICDPEGEYAPLIEAMGDIGSVIRVSAGGRDRLNAMYMVDGYGENNPIVVKSEFIMSLIEQIDKKGVGPQHKSIIDRCIANVYRNAYETGTTPTLCTLREMLLEQPEPEAKQIALSLELYTTGSLDIFGHQSNVDLDKRVVVFDIHGLGAQLKPTGLLVITDTMLNRVTLNWKKGKRTHVFIDEFHVVFENEFSAQFFNSAWRQFRKRNAYPTAITQNVEYLLDSVQASTMLSNSEFIVMLNQAASDRGQLLNCWGIVPLTDMLSMVSTRELVTEDTSENREQAYYDMAWLTENMIMRSRTHGGYKVLLDELWEFCEQFNADMVILWEHMSCKALDGMHGLFEERAREHGIHLIWVTHDLFDPRVVSRQGVRQQVNDYMRTVMQEEPVDPSLEILKDDKSW